MPHARYEQKPAPQTYTFRLMGIIIDRSQVQKSLGKYQKLTGVKSKIPSSLKVAVPFEKLKCSARHLRKLANPAFSIEECNGHHLKKPVGAALAGYP
jgi:hypothetical protein